MSKIQLQAAKEFIINKQYDVARTILEALDEDETAKAWLISLNKNTLLTPKSLPVKEASDKHLCETINQNESYAELLLRIHLYFERYTWGKVDPNTVKIDDIVDNLIINLSSNDGQKIERTCSLLVILQYDSQDILNKLGTLLDYNDSFNPIHDSARNTLLRLGDQGLLKLKEIESKLIIEEINYNVVKSGKTGLDCEYKVTENKEILFSIKIYWTEANRYKVVYPMNAAMTDHLEEVLIVSRIAEDRVHMLNIGIEFDEEEKQRIANGEYDPPEGYDDNDDEFLEVEAEYLEFEEDDYPIESNETFVGNEGYVISDFDDDDDDFLYDQ